MLYEEYLGEDADRTCGQNSMMGLSCRDYYDSGNSLHDHFLRRSDVSLYFWNWGGRPRQCTGTEGI